MRLEGDCTANGSHLCASTKDRTKDARRGMHIVLHVALEKREMPLRQAVDESSRRESRGGQYKKKEWKTGLGRPFLVNALKRYGRLMPPLE